MAPLQNDTTGYAERYAYVLWLRAAGRLWPESDNDIAAGAGVSRQWLQKWRYKNTAPNERIMTRNLVRFLDAPYGWDVEEWLLDGVGQPPRSDLWAVWVAAREHLVTADASAPGYKPPEIGRVPLKRSAPTKHKVEKGRSDRAPHKKHRRTGT